MSLLSEEPFLSARVLSVRLSSKHQTIKQVLVSDLGMRKFVRRWIPHDLSAANRRERVLKANLLPEELQADEENDDRHSEPIVDIFAMATVYDKQHFSGHISPAIRLHFSRYPFA
jgi:hypothetical protein